MRKYYNVMEKQTNTDVKRGQVVYLYEVLKKSYAEIAEITGYAIATVRSYVNKFSDLLEWAKSIFEKVKKEVKHYWCYWIRIFQNGQLIFNKIGTTREKDPYKRFEQIIRKGWTGYDPSTLSYEVRRIYDTNGLNPEGLESHFRSKLMQIYNDRYVANDRFIMNNIEEEPLMETMDDWALTYGAKIYV